ncbi:putative pentatricopeptide repeat-containing protein [Ananas comosus]|uniref:Putative pentatricopeptide repeat-containing protein n=1 Tax=Ananas comosus TaxID=4615 RepID=A0A199V3W9_ANACO|nr:putative pentatricopeptide repeat-containing protein [Ananas comosus]
MPLHVPSQPLPTCPRALGGVLLSLSAARALPQGQQLHAHLLKSGRVPSSSPSSPLSLLSNHLITFYARCSLPLHSLRAFRDLPAAAPAPAASWCALLSSLAQNALPLLALSVFRSMLRAGVPPSDRSLPSAAKSAAALSLPSLARSLHALALKSPFSPDVFVSSSLLDMYAKCALLPDALRLFHLMPSRNVVSWSALISAHAADPALHPSALAIFRSALESGVDVNDFTLSSVARVCAAATLLALGAQVHARAAKSGLDASPFVGSALVSLYSKCGLAAHADQVFDEMPRRNLGAWNAALAAAAQHGRAADAFRRFEAMRAAGFRPNYITFLCLLTACSHAGLVGEGRRYFALMPEHGVEPGPEHYAAMVDLLGRSGRIPEALAFVESMPVEPTESVWSALLTACRIHKDTGTAALAADRLFAAGSLSSGASMLLSGAYAAAGRYADAARARKEMRDRGVRKETGLSWLEAGGKVHTFVSGDRRHARSEEIYRKLEEVGERMELAGYVADTSEVGRDVGGEEKRAAVRYHSERLAIGLGLLVVPEGVPIRVMKNLRVCSDCHTAIKYLSKCTGRTVVLRDNHRFHRFESGQCSCRDFW